MVHRTCLCIHFFKSGKGPGKQPRESPKKSEQSGGHSKIPIGKRPSGPSTPRPSATSWLFRSWRRAYSLLSAGSGTPHRSFPEGRADSLVSDRGEKSARIWRQSRAGLSRVWPCCLLKGDLSSPLAGRKSTRGPYQEGRPTDLVQYEPIF